MTFIKRKIHTKEICKMLYLMRQYGWISLLFMSSFAFHPYMLGLKLLSVFQIQLILNSQVFSWSLRWLIMSPNLSNHIWKIFLFFICHRCMSAFVMLPVNNSDSDRHKLEILQVHKSLFSSCAYLSLLVQFYKSRPNILNMAMQLTQIQMKYDDEHCDRTGTPFWFYLRTHLHFLTCVLFCL